ncbi:MAG: hypothetical protein AB1452_07165 [Pseudomonadota bacterium]
MEPPPPDDVRMRLRISVLLIAAAISGAVAGGETPRTELIYGGELMTPAEREQYRRELGPPKGTKNQDQLRERHRERMRDRARKQGVTLREPEGVVQRDPARK